jgi:hypothetical protein
MHDIETKRDVPSRDEHTARGAAGTTRAEGA